MLVSTAVAVFLWTVLLTVSDTEFGYNHSGTEFGYNYTDMGTDGVGDDVLLGGCGSGDVILD